MNNNDYKKIGIILKENEKGNFVYDSVQVLDNNTSLKDSIIYELDGKELTAFKQEEDTRVVIDNAKDAKCISLILDRISFNLLIDQCKSKGYDNDNIIKAIIDILEQVAHNIDKISTKRDGDFLELSFGFSNIKDNNVIEDEIIEKSENNENEKVIDLSNIDPQKIADKIKEKVIAQDNAVDTIVNNIYTNQLIFNTGDENMISVSKASILMDGPTGTGKSLIIKEVAKELGLPMIISSSTIYSSAGYKGENLNGLLVSLLDKTKGNLKMAERGIIVLDEFDKLGKERDDQEQLSIKKAVQQDLLSYMSGAKFPVEYKGRTIEFDTSKITFICLGAFTDLRERKIRENLNADGQYTISENDYIEQDILREIIGRFSLLTATNSLGKADMIKILKESKISPLINFKEMAKRVHNKTIICSDKMIEKIVEEALSKNTGARALQTVINAIRNAMKDLLISKNSEQELEITDEIFEEAKKISVRYANEYERKAA